MALILGIVALQQTTDPHSTTLSTVSPAILDSLRDQRLPASQLDSASSVDTDTAYGFSATDNHFTPGLPRRNVPGQ